MRHLLARRPRLVLAPGRRTVTRRSAATLTLVLTVVSQTGWQPPVLVPGNDLQPLVARVFEPPASAYGRGHRGVDLRLAPGAEVLAPRDGTVTFRGWVAGRPLVVLQHEDGLRSTLEPVTSTLNVGSRVGAGAVVGHLDAAGTHCAPAACLHWGVRTPDGAYLDPLALLDRPRAVLLPDEGW